LREGCARTSEEIITELFHEIFGPPPEGGASDTPDGDSEPGKARPPVGAATTR
jgi:hypothetical protein